MTSLEICQIQRDEIRQERDAAMKRIAVLEARMAAMFYVLKQHPDTKASELDGRIDEYLSFHMLAVQ